MLDPAGFTPHYDANLCHGLAARGHTVILETSDFLFEPVVPLQGYRLESRFFNLLGHLPPLTSLPVVRQALKAGLYPIEVARLLSRILRAVPDIVHVQWSLLPLLDALILAR